MPRDAIVFALVAIVAGCECGSVVAPADARGDAPLEPDAPVCVDTDGDGIGDEVEDSWGTDADTDGDGRPNRDDLDSDDDGVLDREETTAGDPATCSRGVGSCGTCTGARFVTRDSDGDGIEDGDERTAGTDDCDVDSDDDECPDGLEAIGCGPDRIIFVHSCDFAPLEVVFTAPNDGATRARVTLEIVAPVGSDLETLFDLFASSSVPALTVDGASFLDVPPGASLVFQLRPGFPRDGAERIDATLRIVGGAGEVEARPFHVLVPDCCHILI